MVAFVTVARREDLSEQAEAFRAVLTSPGMANWMALANAALPNSEPRTPWWQRYGWLIGGGFYLCVVFAWGAWTCLRQPECRPLEGFSGNLLAGLTMNGLFVFLAQHLGLQVEQLQKRVHGLTRALGADAYEKHLQGTLSGLWADGDYENIALEFAASDRLTYRIQTVRAGDREPLRFPREIEEAWYVVKIIGPAHQTTDEAVKARYAAGPLKAGTHVFVKFFNYSWHLAADSSESKWLPFYVSGKVSQAEFAVSADDYVKQHTQSSPRAEH